MANHYVGCIVEDLAKHMQKLSLPEDQKYGYLYHISHWGDEFDAPRLNLELAGKTVPEKTEMLPLFLELARLAEESGDVGFKGALYRAVAVELSDELEGKFDERWIPVIEELRMLLCRDDAMERTYGEFAGYDEELLEYDEEYAEEAPNLCGWTAYFRDWCANRRRAAKPCGKAPTELMSQLEQLLKAWGNYVSAYPYNMDACRFLAGELAVLVGLTIVLQQTCVNTLVNLWQAHPEDPYMQRQYMAALVAPGKVTAMPFMVIAAQHPSLAKIAHAFPENPDVQAEYANFLYLLAERARAENQPYDSIMAYTEELREMLLRNPENTQVSNWYIRALLGDSVKNMALRLPFPNGHGYPLPQKEAVIDARQGYGFSEALADYFQTQNGLQEGDGRLLGTPVPANAAFFEDPHTDLRRLFGLAEAVEIADSLGMRDYFFPIGETCGGNLYVEVLQGKWKGYIGDLDHGLLACYDNAEEYLADLPEIDISALSRDQIADLLCDPGGDLFVLHASSIDAMLQNGIFQDDNIYVVVDETDLGKYFPPQSVQSKQEQIPAAELEQIVAEFREKTLQPAVNLRLVKRETSVYGSKVGGKPYLPPGFDYPTRDGAPLWLLAQLNFEELPHLPGFPETGMLQFYIAATDHYGADFEDLTGQRGFQAVYHPQLERDLARLQAPPEMDLEEAIVPFAGEFALAAEPAEMPMSFGDFRFDPIFLQICRRHFPTDVERVWDLGMELNMELEELFPGEGHRMGGYPYFTQQDPRQEQERYKDYTILLLQLDTDEDDPNHGIMWGDAGVGSFYITPEQLAARDFSKVLYTWDCG